MSVLIVAEHDNRDLHSNTRCVITAAEQLSNSVCVLIAGTGCGRVAEQAADVDGVDEVLYCDAPEYQHQLAENIAPLVVAHAERFSHLLAAASTTGKDLMPRIAAQLDVAQVSDITGIENPDTFIRPIYAGNVVAVVRTTDYIKVLTVRTTAFGAAPDGNRSAPITTIESAGETGLSRFAGQELTRSPRPDLTDAEIIVAGGRGLGSAENFQLLEQLADKLGAAIGASRAAVDAGFVPNDYQVGQTGKVVAPKLYIAVGISGAIQHLAGMQDSRTIVAINKDPDAAIFKVADYGIVGDLFTILPEMIAALD